MGAHLKEKGKHHGFYFRRRLSGKTDFAKEAFSLAEGDIFSCSGTEIDFSRRCVDNIENFTLACTRAGIDPVEYFRVHRGEWEESILICRDMFCGVVPMARKRVRGGRIPDGLRNI